MCGPEHSQGQRRTEALGKPDSGLREPGVSSRGRLAPSAVNRKSARTRTPDPRRPGQKELYGAGVSAPPQSGELRRSLRRQEGVAPVSSGGHRCRAMHRQAADATDGFTGRGAGPCIQGHDPRGRSVRPALGLGAARIRAISISSLQDGSELQFSPYVKAGAPQSLRNSRVGSPVWGWKTSRKDWRAKAPT